MSDELRVIECDSDVIRTYKIKSHKMSKYRDHK